MDDHDCTSISELDVDVLNLRLPNNFAELSAKAQFFERRGLFSRLFKFYKDKELRRLDLATMKRMNHEGSSLKYEALGHVPGIEETDVFVYCSEVVVVGLHRQVQRGIAHVPHEGETVACSVVVSGGYIDDFDQGNLIEYTGQGGNDCKRSKHQISDRSLDVANKALITNWRLKEPVRVFRAQLFKQYSYGGIFQVIGYKYEPGKDGHKVYKYILQR